MSGYDRVIRLLTSKRKDSRSEVDVYGGNWHMVGMGQVAARSMLVTVPGT